MTATVEVVDHVGMGRVEGPVADLVDAVLEAVGREGALVVAFVDEPGIAVLNRVYRGLDESTDVLSFAESDAEGWTAVEDGGEADADLGELVVCPSVVYRYAEEDGREPRRQLGWTLIHGLLHLVGYDHEVDDGEMRHREQELLTALGPMVDALPATKEAEHGS